MLKKSNLKTAKKMSERNETVTHPSEAAAQRCPAKKLLQKFPKLLWKDYSSCG